MLDIASPLDMALAYAGHGWAVFPLIGKVPAIAGGHGFQDATMDRWRILDWWGTVPAWDVGIATGKVSGLTVIDIDTYNLSGLLRTGDSRAAITLGSGDGVFGGGD